MAAARKVRIVTDSGAGFEDPHAVQELGIKVVPLRVKFGSHHARDGVDLDAEEMLHRLRHNNTLPEFAPPTVEDFEEVYGDLARRTKSIVVVTHSKHFSKTFENARAARTKYLGRCDITVVDSQTLSVGLGYLAEELAKAANDGAKRDEVVHLARAVVPRLYSVFYVDTLEYIQRGGLIAESQAILGTMLEIKPLITIEDGELMTMEKVRTHSQAVDRMMEFVTEFTHIDRLCILQNTLRTTDRTRMLQDRLALEFSRTNHPVKLYEPLLASLIGPEGMGMALLEGDPDEE